MEKIDNLISPKRPILGLAIIILLSIPWWFGIWRIGELLLDAFT